MSDLFKIPVTQYWLHDCWIDSDGNPCDQAAPGARYKRAFRVTKATPGAKIVRMKSTKWYGRVNGKPVPLSVNKEAARIMLGELLKKTELHKAGAGDPFEDQKQKPLREHLDDYRRYLEAEGNCGAYVQRTIAQITAILDGCGFAFTTDLAAEKVTEFLHRLRRDPPRPALPAGQELFTPREMIAALGGIRPPRLAKLIRREGLAVTSGNGKKRRYPRATVETLQDRVCRGINITTSNSYLRAMKGFSRWLNKTERIERDRLVSLSRLNEKTDRRHERRALEETELQALLVATLTSERIFEGLTGTDRHMLYAVAMTTGFRAKELANLCPSSFDLEADRPTVMTKAAFSKNRREAIQPLAHDVANALRSYLADRPASLPVWPGRWFTDAAEMLRFDLEAAGMPYRDSDGRVCDFHALRHSYVSLLARSGVHPKLAQELARHSDIKLTMNVYTHARLHDLAGAVNALPPLLDVRTGPMESKATGTLGSDFRLTPVCAKGDTPRDSVRLADTGSETGEGKHTSQNPLILQGVEAGGDSSRLVETELPRLDSNQDKESQNLLCYRYTTGYHASLIIPISERKSSSWLRDAFAGLPELFQVVFRRRLGRDAARGDFEPGGPGGGVEEQGAEAVVLQIRVIVVAGEAEAAAAVGANVGPGDMLCLAGLHLIQDGVIPVMRFGFFAIPAASDGFHIGQGRQHRRDPLHVLNEAHVIVPLVVDLERLDAARGFMLGNFLDLGGPVGVDRPERLEIASHPFEVGVALHALVDFDAVVDGHEAGLVFLDGVLDGRVGRRLAAVVQENDDGVGMREVLRPARVGIDDGVGVGIG